MNLIEYVEKYAIRGACTCGHCCDAPDKPEEKQPTGHTVDLTFFKVAMNNNPSANEFRIIIETEFPHWLDGKEHDYLQCGAEIGDQGIALMTFGLGHLLGIWKVLSPETMMPFLPEEVKKQMAGMGMVKIQVQK